jgi:prepilin-type N-terminal cleavage/methylation domain-containing protein
MRPPRGFTLIELLIVVSLIGGMMALAFPKYSQATSKEGTIGARREVVTQVSRARSVAAQRGCRATLHLSAASDRVWVTSCRISGGGIDTVGMVSGLRTRYNVDFTSSADSLVFSPTSLALGTGSIALGFSRNGQSSAMRITSIGRPVW